MEVYREFIQMVMRSPSFVGALSTGLWRRRQEKQPESRRAGLPHELPEPLCEAGHGEMHQCCHDDLGRLQVPLRRLVPGHPRYVRRQVQGLWSVHRQRFRRLHSGDSLLHPNGGGQHLPVAIKARFESTPWL